MQNTKIKQDRKDDIAAYQDEIERVALPESEKEKPLLKNNFIIIGISLLMIILGFVLMTGSGSGLEEYNPDIFSTRRIVVGPLLSFLGFVLLAVGIIVKPKSK